MDPEQKKKIIIISSIAGGSLVVLGLLIWLLFPVLLRAFSPTLYTQYSLVRTGNVLSAEAKKIDNFFGFPDFSDSGATRVAVDIDGLSAGLSFGNFNTPRLDLSKLNLGVEVLHDRDDKQALLNLRAGWDEKAFNLALFANTKQIALGFTGQTSFVINQKTFGKELAGLGLPIDEEMELDLGFLFPDALSDEEKEEVLTSIMDFVKSLKFKRNKDVSNPDVSGGVAMTATFDGTALKELLTELADLYYWQPYSEDNLYGMIRQIRSGEHELTFFIDRKHHIRAVQVDVSTDIYPNVSVSAQLTGAKNMLDYISLEVLLDDNRDKRSFTFKSEGQHIPVDGLFSSATAIDGFDIGKIRFDTELNEDGSLSISTNIGFASLTGTGRFYSADDIFGITLKSAELNALPYISATLTGELGIEYGNDISELRDITIGAHDIADIEISNFFSLFQVIWEIVRQDQTLMDIIGKQLTDFIINSLLGNRLGAYVLDLLGDRPGEILSFINNLLSGEYGGIMDLLRYIIGDQIGGVLDSLGEQLGGVFDGLLEGIGSLWPLRKP